MNLKTSLFLAIAIIPLLLGCSSTKVISKDKSPDNEQLIANTSIFIEAKKSIFKGDTETAAELLKKILATDPNNHAAAYELSRCILNSYSPEVLSYALKAYNLDPENIWYSTNLANLYLKTKNYKKGVDIFQKQIKAHPNDLNSYYYLLNAHLVYQKPKKAIKVLDMIEAKFGFNESNTLKKKDLYVQTNQNEKAIELLKNLIANDGGNKRYYGSLSDIYMKMGKEAEALSMLEKVAAIDPEDGKVNLVLSSYYYSKGQKQASFDQMKIAMASKGLPVDEKVEIMMKMYKGLEQYPNDQSFKLQSDTLLEIFITHHPDDAKAMAMYGDFLVREKKWTRALEQYKKVIEIDSSRYPVWEQTILITKELSNYSEMQKYSRRAMELFPQYPALYYFNALSLNNLSRFAEAEASLNLGLSFVYKPQQQVQFYCLMGMVRDSMLRHNEAEVSFQKALIADPNNREALLSFSKHLHIIKKDLKAAEQNLRKALELNIADIELIVAYVSVLTDLEDWKTALYWTEKGLSIDSTNNQLPILKLEIEKRRNNSGVNNKDNHK